MDEIHKTIQAVFLYVYFLIVPLHINLFQECFRDVSSGGDADTFETDEYAGLTVQAGDATAHSGELAFDDFDVVAQLSGEGIVEIDADMLVMLHGDTDKMAHLFERDGHLSIHACLGFTRVIVHEAKLPWLTMRLILKRYRTILIISKLLFARVCKKHVRQSGFLFHYAFAVAHARYGERGRVR